MVGEGMLWLLVLVESATFVILLREVVRLRREVRTALRAFVALLDAVKELAEEVKAYKDREGT